MAEYIERKQLIGSLEDVIADYRDEHTFSTDFAATVVTDILNNVVKCLPAADVALVRHGRWIKHDDGVLTCSECGNAESIESYFCRYCWAKIDGDG